MSDLTQPSAPPRFSPLTLAFHDRWAERLFVVENNRRAVSPVRVLLLLYLATTLAVTLFDAVVASPLFMELLPYRVGGIAGAAIGLALSRTEWAVRHGQMVFGGFLVMLHGGLYVAIGLFGEHIGVLSPLLIMMLAMTLALPALLFRFALPLALLASLLYALRMAAFMPGVTSTMPIFFLGTTVLVLVWGNYASERARRTAWAASRALANEKARSEALLLNVLPPSVAARMRAGERLIADSHAFAAVLFADIVGFTPLSETMPPAELVSLLDRVFTRFDAIADAHDLEKIKTIGDAYMLAAGAPSERPAEPARICEAALEMRAALAEVSAEAGVALGMRIGIHAGPIVAGVIGRRKFVYDVWGDTVNTASRMESTAPAGEIQVSERVATALAGRFTFEPRGEIDVKGKGPMSVYLMRS